MTSGSFCSEIPFEAPDKFGRNSEPSRDRAENFAMWLIAFVLGFVLYTQPASAFDCAGVTLPSSIVICSDPALMRIADDRQQVFNEARARLGEQNFPRL